MNIKNAPCMARIVAPGSSYNSWLVNVLNLSPAVMFYLPDGHLSHPSAASNAWVCESLMFSDFKVKLDNGLRRRTRYVVIDDHFLRELPGLDVVDEVTTHDELEVA